MKDKGCGCALINSENKVLLGLRCKKDDKREWGFPGGKIEPNEEPNEAVKREIFEETGLRVDEIEFLGSFEHENVEDFIFISRNFSGEASPQPGEIKELRWFSFDELKDIPIYPFTKKALSLYGDTIFKAI